MPADHLTPSTPPTDQLVAAILALTTGANTEKTAAPLHISAQQLKDAADTYHAAGLAALEHRAEQDWYNTYITFTDWQQAETIAVAHLGPALAHLQDTGQITGWWFVRKHSAWRLRATGANPADTRSAVDAALTKLISAGHLASTQPSIYEPECAAFGGPAGTNIAHRLFCADSTGAVRLFGQPGINRRRREISLLLCTALFRAAGLDAFESGDVFDKLTALRPLPPDVEAAGPQLLAASIAPLLLVPEQHYGELFPQLAPSGPLAPWLDAFRDAGAKLQAVTAADALDRSLRNVITHLVIFHWNRLGLSSRTQAGLAHASKLAAFLQ
jgi:thiopeptide-type bacteriocin biosynthesis protein